MKVKLAYDILGDPQKRGVYELFLQTDFTLEEKTMEYVNKNYRDEKERE